MKPMIKPGTMIWLSPAEREAVKYVVARFYVECELLGFTPSNEAVVSIKWERWSRQYEVWIAYTFNGERRKVLYYAPIDSMNGSN